MHDIDSGYHYVGDHLTAFAIGTILVIGGVACVVVSGGACIAAIIGGFAEGGLYGGAVACVTSTVCETAGAAAFCAAMVCDGALSDGGGPGTSLESSPGDVSPQTPIGARGKSLQIAFPDGASTRNLPGAGDGIDYSGHAFDRIQQ